MISLVVYNVYYNYMKPLSGVCIFRDIMTIYSEPPPGMCIVPDKDDTLVVYNVYYVLHETSQWCLYFQGHHDHIQLTPTRHVYRP